MLSPARLICPDCGHKFIDLQDTIRQLKDGYEVYHNSSFFQSEGNYENANRALKRSQMAYERLKLERPLLSDVERAILEDYKQVIDLQPKKDRSGLFTLFVLLCFVGVTYVIVKLFLALGH